jgi:DNA-binding transcriptional LysR family regulator
LSQPPHAASFRLVVVPGVTVDKWARVWAERVPAVDLKVVPTDAGLLLPADADAGLLRLPVDPDTFHAVPLYTESTVVVVPREHLVAAADEVTLADLADETLLRPLDDVLAWPDPPSADVRTAEAFPLVAAEVGLLVVPQSLARLHHRKDLTYRVVTDAPTSSVGLVWRRDAYTPLVEELIGVVRGRTANSTRGRPQQPPARTASPRTGTRRGATSRRRGR